MWSVAHLCRCSRIPSQLLASGARSGITNTAARQLAMPVRSTTNLGNNKTRVFRISEVFKSSGVAPRSGPPAPPRAVGYWLLGCSGMVFGAVVLGMVSGYALLLYCVYYVLHVALTTTNGSGVTRLTESGLSMVTWRLLGERAPAGERQWQAEFHKYQQFPEFKYKNQQMTLSEFKWIWWMEFAHRSWGRAIGAAMFLPAAYFWARGALDRGTKARVGVCCALVAAQGLMGWYMVRSGLEDRFQGPADVPRVSQYRLAAHLGLAFALYAALLAAALRVLRPAPAGVLTRVKALAGITALSHSVKAMTFFTALSGAFVAGLDAGLVYNSFPRMGDGWLPPDALALRPALRNFTENPATVQLDHRVLGLTTLALATLLALRARRAPLSPAARRLALGVGAAAWAQVCLGVLTLLQYVPTPLAAGHQAGSLLLLSLAVWLTHEVKLLKYVPK